MDWLWRIVIVSILGGIFISACLGSLLLLSIVILAFISIDFILDLKDERVKRENHILSQIIDKETGKSIIARNENKLNGKEGVES